MADSKFGLPNLKIGTQTWNSKFGLPNLNIGQIPSLGTTSIHLVKNVNCGLMYKGDNKGF